MPEKSTKIDAEHTNIHMGRWFNVKNLKNITSRREMRSTNATQIQPASEFYRLYRL